MESLQRHLVCITLYSNCPDSFQYDRPVCNERRANEWYTERRHCAWRIDGNVYILVDAPNKDSALT